MPLPSVIALVLIRHPDQRILLSESPVINPDQDQLFYRPLGGHIELHETAVEAVLREVQEEIGQRIVEPRYLATIENLFTYRGEPGHEIDLIFEADFADHTSYQIEQFPRVDDKQVSRSVAWMPLSAFTEGQQILYPTGLVRVLTTPGVRFVSHNSLR